MYRVGMLGMGGIGTHLADDLEATAGAEFVAAVDIDEERQRLAQREYGVPSESLYEDAAAMYAGEELDAVIITTPPGFHYQQLRDALDEGVHILCEKPLVTTTEEARDIVARVANSQEVLMVGYQRHLDPAFIAARERWHDSDCTPRFMTGELTQDWTDYFEDGTNWRTDPEIGGGGHLFSVGTHVLEAVLWMTGLTPETVSAEMVLHDDTDTIDKQSSLSVRFDNGALGSFGDSAVVPATREHVHIWDQDGAVYLEGKGWGQRDLLEIDAEGEEFAPDLGDGPSKVAAFLEAIESGSEPPATAEDALHVTALLEAAYESARSGERTTVDI